MRQPACSYAENPEDLGVHDHKETIERQGQPYVDEPVIVRPKANIMQRAVTLALGARPQEPKPLTIGYNRVKLRWMQPDGKGGLMPKYQNREKKRGD